jgi:hypothetical protein
LIALVACALAGCGEEIHYKPPPPTTDTTASDFADDVAAELADEPTSAAGVSAPATTPEPTTPESTTPAPVDPLPNAADPARGPRRMAWLLGSNLSLAALANDRAAAADKVADWFDKSQRLATLLGTSVTDLPARPAADQIDPHADKAMEYLFDQGQSIGQHLATQYGDDHAALFELAVKSNILLVLYQPEAPVVKSLTVAIDQAAERANLPSELWQPLIKLLDDNAPAKEVRDAVFQLHADVDRYLSTANS